jgi:hypothetical protein
VYHSDRGSQGGFNRSSQRSSERGLRLACGLDGRIELGGRRCARRAVRRLGLVRSCRYSGRRSLAAS